MLQNASNEASIVTKHQSKVSLLNSAFSKEIFDILEKRKCRLDRSDPSERPK